MELGIQRRKIEDAIVAQFNAVNFNAPGAAWVDTAAFEDFVFAYFDLRRYYETSTDTTIGLEAVRVYMDGLRALKAVIENREANLDRRDKANRLFYELNYQVEAVMYEIDRNRQDNDSGANRPYGNLP